MPKVKEPLQLFIAFVLSIIAITGIANYMQIAQSSLSAGLAGKFSAVMGSATGQAVVPLACSPSTQTVNSGQPISVRVTGGNGLSYVWYAHGEPDGGGLAGVVNPIPGTSGNPANGNGRNFTTTYTNSGTQPVRRIIQVFNQDSSQPPYGEYGGQFAYCNVIINPALTSSCAAPSITTFSPSAAYAPVALSPDNPSFRLTINGTNFTRDSVVHFGGSERVTTFISSTQVSIMVQGIETRYAGNESVQVFNPSCQTTPNNPNGSNVATFTINANSTRSN